MFGLWKEHKLFSFVIAGNVMIGICKSDCTVNVVSCDSSAVRQLLRCYRELLVRDWIENILNFDSLGSLGL